MSPTRKCDRCGYEGFWDNDWTLFKECYGGVSIHWHLCPECCQQIKAFLLRGANVIH